MKVSYYMLSVESVVWSLDTAPQYSWNHSFLTCDWSEKFNGYDVGGKPLTAPSTGQD